MGLFDKLFKKKSNGLILSEKTRNNINTLVAFSIDNGVPILVGNQDRINALKQVNENVEVYGFAKNYTKLVSEQEFPNGVIIDRTVEQDMIDYLQIELSHIKIIK